MCALYDARHYQSVGKYTFTVSTLSNKVHFLYGSVLIASMLVLPLQMFLS